MLPRHALPQIPGNKVGEFKKYLEGYDVGVTQGLADIDKLHPIQKNVNVEKVKALRSDKAALKKPIIVSKEGAILDGHHRWIANKSLGEEKQAVMKCDCPIEKLIEFGLEFPDAEIKTINEFIGPTHQTNMTDFGITQVDDTDEEPSNELMVRKTLNYK